MKTYSITRLEAAGVIAVARGLCNLVGVFDADIVVHSTLGQIHGDRIASVHISPQCSSPEPDAIEV